MITRSLKTAFYFCCGPPMRFNAWIYRSLRAPTKGTVKVQLGPGQEHYLEGWINVDANIWTARCDAWADLRNGLPFRDNTVDVFYSHHVIEHLPDDLLPSHFREMYRCLKPGGIFRVGGPNGDSAMRKYIEGDSAWFEDYPDRRECLGGRLANFILCRGEHLTILTPSYVNELARAAGFKAVSFCKPKIETLFPSMIDDKVLGMEYERTFEMPHTLIVEAQK